MLKNIELNVVFLMRKPFEQTKRMGIVQFWAEGKWFQQVSHSSSAYIWKIIRLTFEFGLHLKNYAAYIWKIIRLTFEFGLYMKTVLQITGKKRGAARNFERNIVCTPHSKVSLRFKKNEKNRYKTAKQPFAAYNWFHANICSRILVVILNKLKVTKLNVFKFL